MFDGEAFGAEIVTAVKAYLAREVNPLREQIAQLQAEIAQLQARPDVAEVDARIAAAVEALPAPAPGSPGRDGRDVDPEAVGLMVAQAFAALPPPADGKSVSLEDVAPLIVAEVERAVAALPPPTAPVSVVGALIDRDGNLVLTHSDGAAKAVGQVVGRDGIDGKDGQDGANGVRGERGFGLDAFDTELLEDGRTVRFKFSAGDTLEIHELTFPVVIDRGVYKAEQVYVKGDGVTWGGSFWIAQRDTSDKPETSDGWRLAVKKGRDGKNGAPGDPGPPGKKGDPGRDGRSYG